MSCERDYFDLQGDRDIYLDRARVAAAYTVPYLIPLSDDATSTATDQHPLPWNGVGQRGVHNLASRLMLALMPPTETFFRFTIDEIEMMKQEAELLGAGQDPAQIAEQRSQFDIALARLELAVLRSIETSNDRVAVHEMLMHLVVAGNVLLHVSEKGLRCFHLNRYVLRRDPVGNPLLCVICEELSYDRLPEKVRALIDEEDGSPGDASEDHEYSPKRRDRTIKVYTKIEWKAGKVYWCQEVKGKEIPGSDYDAPLSESPWLPVRMYKIDGHSYSPGYIEAACLADLKTEEALTQAIAEGSLVSAQVKHLVKPNAVTSAKDLANAANGAYLPGNPEDVFTIQVNKAGDLSVALQFSARVEARLSQAFMLNDVRDSERTTAEEVRLHAQQVEMSLGAIYSILTVEFQQPYVSRKLALLLKAGKLPTLPEMVKPVVSVGLAAVGRGNDLEKTARFMQILQGTLGPEGIATYVKSSELIRRLAASMGMSIIGLVKTDEEIASERQAQQQAAMASQAMAAGMADPQKLANAAATTQQMAAQPPPGEAPPGEMAA